MVVKVLMENATVGMGDFDPVCPCSPCPSHRAQQKVDWVEVPTFRPQPPSWGQRKQDSGWGGRAGVCMKETVLSRLGHHKNARNRDPGR